MFAERLSLLLEAFGVQNNRLARSLNVDPSLVSKWKHGRREPSAGSDAVQGIVEFFAAQRWNADSPRLADVMGPALVHSLVEHPEGLQVALKQWLFPPADTAEQARRAEELLPRTLIDHVRSLSARGQKVSRESSPIPVPSLPLREGTTLTGEAFGGTEGTRQAMLQLAAELFDGPRGQTLMLASPSDLRYFTDQPSFLTIWMRIMRALISQGHRIRVIFKLDRDVDRLVSMMKGWLPLLTTGKVRAFVLPVNVVLPFEWTFGVVPNRLAAVTLHGAEPDNDQTLLYRHRELVQLFAERFETLAESGSPLLEVFSSDNVEELMSLVLETEQRAGFTYEVRDGLSPVTIPPALYERLLTRAGFEHQQLEKRMLAHQARRRAFMENITVSEFRQVFSLEALDRMGSGTWHYPGSDLFSAQGVEAEPSELLEQLQHVIELLQRYPNFRLGLTHQTHDYQQDMGWRCKEDSLVALEPRHTGGEPLSVVLRQPVVFRQFETEFESIWEQLPPANRNRDWVVRKLQSRIERLGAVVEDRSEHRIN